MINHEKVKELGIKPERVRELVWCIEAQNLKNNMVKSSRFAGLELRSTPASNRDVLKRG